VICRLFKMVDVALICMLLLLIIIKSKSLSLYVNNEKNKVISDSAIIRVSCYYQRLDVE
jgi:hypothetical protein